MPCPCGLRGIDRTTNHSRPSGLIMELTSDSGSVGAPFEPCLNHIHFYRDHFRVVQIVHGCPCDRAGSNGKLGCTETSTRRFQHDSGEIVIPCTNHLSTYILSQYYREVIEDMRANVTIGPCPHISHESNRIYGELVYERIAEGTRFASCGDHHWSREIYAYIGTRDQINAARARMNQQQDQHKWYGPWGIEGKRKRFKPTKVYMVQQRDDGYFKCDCPMFRHQDLPLEEKEECEHIIKQKLKLAQENGFSVTTDAKKQEKPLRKIRFKD